MLSQIEALILTFVDKVPLEIFVFVASFVEEVFAPLPSASVLLVTGAIAAAQDKAAIALVPLIILAAVGKTLGAILVYYLAYFLGHNLIVRYGRWFGVSVEKVEKFGQNFTGHARSFWLFTLLRALPIVPSALVSIGGGILKIAFPLYLIATLIGTLIRDTFFIYVGYSGVDVWRAWADQSTTLESYVQLVVLVLIIYLGVRLYWRAKRQAKDWSV